MKYSKLGGGWRRRLRHDQIFPVRRPPQQQVAGDRSPGGRRRGNGEERKQSVCGGSGGRKPRGMRATWKIKPAGGGEGSFTERKLGAGAAGRVPRVSLSGPQDPAWWPRSSPPGGGGGHRGFSGAQVPSLHADPEPTAPGREASVPSHPPLCIALFLPNPRLFLSQHIHNSVAFSQPG